MQQKDFSGLESEFLLAQLFWLAFYQWIPRKRRAHDAVYTSATHAGLIHDVSIHRLPPDSRAGFETFQRRLCNKARPSIER